MGVEMGGEVRGGGSVGERWEGEGKGVGEGAG